MTATHNSSALNSTAPSATPVVIDTAHSPHARLRPLPITAVRLTDGFWAPRLHANWVKTLPAQYRLLEAQGRLGNFERAVGKSDSEFRGGYCFNDSDVYKWLEAASWTLATHPEEETLRSRVEETIDLVAAAQRPDGYLNTYFSRERADERWTNFDLHEMYCAGHLFQAAAAHYRATGSHRLLELAIRLADHLCAVFGPEEEGKRRMLDAHPQVEMALVELYRVTANERYLKQAQFFLDARGHGLLGRPYKYFDPDYAQDNAPFRELDRVTGHAVRMMYLDCGATDIYLETGEAALMEALEKQWANMTERRLYVTGSVGSRGDGEAFGKDYQLPSSSAYAETCGAVGCIMWNWRMLLATGEARYADLLELSLYNGLLAAQSLDGTEFFYENPLADDGSHRRKPWHDCYCCPPNVARLLASLPGYFAAVSDAALWLHLYGTSQGAADLPDGQTIGWTQETDYPWTGDVRITLTAAPSTPVALQLRIPNWVEEGAAVTINGQPAGCEIVPGRYAAIQRVWQAGDTLHLHLPMPIRRLVGHPNIVDTYGRTALMRGPLVYCLEQIDHPEADLSTIRLPIQSDLQAVPVPDLLGGVVTLQGDASAQDLSPWEHRLYRPAREAQALSSRATRLTAIPYFAWANRAAGLMTIWIPTETVSST